MLEPSLRAAINSSLWDFKNGNDFQALASILKSCAMASAINWGKALHCSITKMGHISCQFVSKALLNMYAKCGALHDCKTLFNEVGRGKGKDPVFWNILLSGFAASRVYDNETLRSFNDMHIANEPKPSEVTAAIVLPICARSGDVFAGKSVHCYATKSGLDTHTLVGNALVSMYAKWGLVCDDAYSVFDAIDEKDVVSWNAIIAGFAENKMLDDAFGMFRMMLRTPVKPNCKTFVSILPVCACLEEDIAASFGKEVHCFALKQNELDVSAYNALVSFYMRVGKADAAEVLFRGMVSRDLVSWNAIISGYASNGKWSKALKLFRELLLVEMVMPDSVTLLSILSACAQSKNLEASRQIYGFVLQHRFLREDTSVANAFINVFAKCDDIESAYKTFLMISRRDLISWNSMLDAFAEGGDDAQLLELWQWMLKEGIKPDYVTILSMLHFCVNTLIVNKVKEVHGYSIRSSFLLSNAEPKISNALLYAYAKCGNIEYAFRAFQSFSGKKNLVTFNSMITSFVNYGLQDDAYMIFKRMPTTDVTSWNLMVRAYAEHDCPDQALILFHELQAQGMRPDVMTILSILSACAQTASVRLVKQCHGYVIRSCFDDIHLEGALIDLYAKCGSINYASKLFQSNPYKDLVIFTAMIGGFAMHGMGQEALGIFYSMLELGVKPDHVVMTAVLSACSHAGLVDEGLKIFYAIEKEHGMKPTMEQYSCVVDILARRGRIKDAYSVVSSMPIKPAANVWGTLLGACEKHNEVELGQAVANHLLKMETNDIGNYVVLSNMYAADAKWDGVIEIRKLMRTKDLKKPAGFSWIEVESRKNVFKAGDYVHPQRGSIYDISKTLDQQIREPSHSSHQLKLSPDCYK